MKKNKGLYKDIVTVKFMEQFKLELIEKIDVLLSNRTQQHVYQKWMKSKQVMRILTISPGTLQQMRINGQLPFTKVGGVIFYDVDDINKMLELRKRNTESITD